MLTFQFTGAQGWMTETDTLTTGMVGRQIAFRLSPEWDGLRKTAVYMAGDALRIAVDVGQVDTIPWEVLQVPLERLYVGLYGVSGDGKLVIPTIRAQGPVIQPGAEPDGDPSTEAGLPVWAQILSMIGDLGLLETGVRANLVAAINEMVRDNEALARDINAAVAQYLTENPVTPGASLQEAAQIRQNTRDIQTLQEEKLGMDALSEGVNEALAKAKESGIFNGTGTVDSVAGVSPDENGNVTLTAEDIGAAAAEDHHITTFTSPEQLGLGDADLADHAAIAQVMPVNSLLRCRVNVNTTPDLPGNDGILTARKDDDGILNLEFVDWQTGETYHAVAYSSTELGIGVSSWIRHLTDASIIPIHLGGTGATTAEAALAALYGIPKTKPVTATGTNLNSYTATGIYFFSGSVTPTNIPGGTNGWLVVLNATQSDTSTAYVKQIFIRAGAPGSNDFYIWARTKANGGSWGSWCKLLMNTLVSGEYGTSLPAAGSPGRIFFRKVGS